MRFLGVAVVEWSKLLLRTALQFKTDKRRNVPMHGKLVEIIFLEIQSNFHILVAKQVAKKVAKKLQANCYMCEFEQLLS